MGVHFSSLVELQGGNSSVLFTTKMKFPIVLLSATLVYGAANPGYGHAYHNGPHCHDKKEHQCHKKPKQQEHEECYVDYHIIEGQSEVVDAHHEHYGGDYHKRSAQPGEDLHAGHQCHDKREQQCHKHPKENTRKIPKQTCKKIVDTIYIEECEERIYTHCEETHERGHHSTRVVDHHSKVIASSDHSGHHESHGDYHH